MRHPLASVGCAALLVLALGCSRAPPAAGPPAAPPHAPMAAAGGNEPLIVDSDDLVHIEYHVYGSGEPAVVLIHGWLCNSRYWQAQLDELARRYTVVTLDLAGHGASGRNRTDWSIENFAADVAAVVRQLPARSVVLVGHAMGGPVALAATPRIGARVLGVVGVDTFKSLGLPPPPREQVEHELAPFRADFIGTMHSFVPQHLFAAGADPGLIGKVVADMSRASPDIAIASLESLNQMDFGALLPRIHVPIVAINSDLGEPTDVARIMKAAPTFRLITLQGSGHFLMLEAPQRFNPILLRELATLAATPRS